VTNYKSLSKDFMEMFASRFDVRGQTVPTGLKNEKGKEEVDVELFFEAITDQHFELHLQDKLPVSGKTAENCRKVNKALPFCGLGLVPIRPGVNDCKWGCLDIDEYNLDHKKLIQDIIKIGPRMIVFRSKSGGAHVFLFTKEWVSAKLMVEKLESIRDALGLPKRTEVFPKQISVEEEGFGSFLNMPYLGGEFSQRYAHDDEGVAINVKDVKKAYDAKAYTAKELQGLELNKLEQKKKTQAFPDGPPCLNHLAKIGFSEGSRNNALFNIGVYCKKAFDEGEWQAKVGEYNRKYFNPPLTYNEEQQNIKSVGGKTYKYKCSDAPIEEHCKAKECAGCKFGVSDGKGQVVLPKISDLKIVMTKPAVYFVSVEGKEIKLTKDEWLNPSKFFDEAYDQAQFNYPHAVPSKPKWKELVVGPLSVDGVVTKIEGIQSLSPKYILEKHLKDFVTEMSTGNVLADILNGVSFTETYKDGKPKTTFLIASDFETYLTRVNWRHSSNDTTAMLVTIPNYIEEKRTLIEGKKHNVISIKPYEVQKVKGSKPNLNKEPF
jgi:hypothetical protein|tara:strand:+ start:515 stop:2155 length:1641 start_codon:yes stop_codon:yes gene_type:complete